MITSWGKKIITSTYDKWLKYNYHKYHSIKLSQVFSQVPFTNNDHKLGKENDHKYL